MGGTEQVGSVSIISYSFNIISNERLHGRSQI